MNYAFIGSGNDSSPIRRQNIIWSNDCLLLIAQLHKLHSNNSTVILYKIDKFETVVWKKA